MSLMNPSQTEGRELKNQMSLQSAVPETPDSSEHMFLFDGRFITNIFLYICFFLKHVFLYSYKAGVFCFDSPIRRMYRIPDHLRLWL